MKTGTFYGIGLGPGDPELVTLKALRILQDVDRIYSVASRQTKRSVSASIIAALPEVSASLIELEFTMSTEWSERLAKIRENAERIYRELEQGCDCAFVSLGDPMTYSTCSYLLRALAELDGSLNVEIVPGVNSWSLLAAKLKEPLCEDQQVLQIVPSYSAADSIELPDDTTTILLKTYRSRNRLLDMLPDECDIYYGSELGLPGELTCSDTDEIKVLPESYLSMFMIKK